MATTGTTREIVYLSAAQLARHVVAGELSAREVVDAHIARIEAVDDRLGAMVVRRFTEARAEADAQDAARRRGERQGPLVGVPISIKECLDVAGTASTLGVRRLAERITQRDGPLVARLRVAGAIVLGKTNLPQLAMSMETDGPLFGRTSNPWNLSRSPGGSSGGEAALLAAGGTALGLATDAGGSIRQPAHCCGVSGLKPTAGRLTQADLPVTSTAHGARVMPTNLAGLHSILAPGPMARSVDDLALAMRVLAAPGLSEIDPTVAPMAWREPAEVDVAQLRIGLFDDAGQFPASPAIRRATRAAADALRSAGADVVPFTLPDVERATALLHGLIFCDGGVAFRRMLGGERPDQRLAGSLRAAELPNWLRPAVAWFLEQRGQPRMAAVARNFRRQSADGLRKLISARADYTARFLDAMDRAGVDALLGPAFPFVAAPHGMAMFAGLVSSYTGVFNLLGLPAGVVAATRVRPDEATPRTPGRCQVEQAAAEIERGSAGLPVGVQVAARHWREDVALAVMGVLERFFVAQPDYPARPSL